MAKLRITDGKPTAEQSVGDFEVKFDRPVPAQVLPANSPVHTLYMQFIAAQNRGDEEAAASLLQSALQVGPEHPGPWYALGVNLQRAGSTKAAVAAMARALAVYPNEPHAMTNMGIYLHQCARDVEAREWLLKATAAMPEKALGWSNLSLVETTLGNGQAAVDCANRAIGIEPENPSYRVAAAFACHANNQIALGLRHYESRIDLRLKELNELGTNRWDGGEAESIFLAAEQGIGDTLTFARFFPSVVKKVKKVYAGCQPELVRLMTRAFPRVNFIPMPAIVPTVRFNAPVMSVPHCMGMTDDEILAVKSDYLSGLAPRPKDKRINIPRIPGIKLNVGIVWAGNPNQETDKNRSTVIETMLPLAEIPGVQLYSLQVGKRAYDAHPYFGLVIPLHNKIRSFCDTMECVQQMDVIVTTCTSMAHLAGSMGTTPCHVIVQKQGRSWVWGDDDKCKWYKNVWVHRQKELGNWNPAIESVRKVLEGMV